MPKSSLQLVDEVVDEGVPEKEPTHDDEEANLQRALELSLKEQGERTQGPARPVVIREPDSGRIQPLPEVQGKGKEKVAEEQAAHDLLTLQTPKPKNPADQFIFQRRTPMPTEPSEHADSPSLDAELALTDSETESEEEVPVIKAGDQDEGQAGSNPGEQDEGQAGSNPEGGGEEEPGKTNAEAEVSRAVNEIVTDAVDWEMQAPLRARFRDLPTVALQKSVELDYSNQRLADQEEARKKKRKRRESPITPLGSPPTQPPPPPPPAGASGAPSTFGASGSSQLPPPYPPPSTSTSRSTPQQGTDILGAQELSPTDYLMHVNSIPEEQVHLSDDEDSKNDHQPKADSRKDWWKPLPEEERPATPKPAWTIPSSNKSDVVNKWASALATTYDPPTENSLLAKIGDMTTFMNWYCQKFQMEECHKMLTDQVDWTNPEGAQVRVDVNRPLHLGGPPCHVTIQTQFFFNKDLEYLRYGSKGSSPALSISKMKAASYPDLGLELLVSEHMWIDDACTYDINATYGISH
ncbi:retrovirus-related pol polyprotein from transposon TNT 1-94 [Tanacetum coccineum]